MLTYSVQYELYLVHTLSHGDSNTSTMILILEYVQTIQQGFKEIWRKFAFLTQKKPKKSTFKNPPDLPADFVSYVQFSSFSYLTFTKQGQDAAVLITCSILSVAYELLWTKHKANTI